ncbi:3-hydroxyacyl-CoA dehydrogenase family protein [Burkholderiaceae bacterium UC74_6]
MDKSKSVAVIGAGLMGHGIAQVFAQAGHPVVITDPDSAVLEVALERVAGNLQEEGIDPAAVVGRIRLEPRLEAAVAGADLVLEAAPEKLALKQLLFAQIAVAAPPHAILASNTSVIPITQIGERLGDEARSRLVGTHWWNPPHLVPLVEVVRSEFTRDAVFNEVFDWLLAVGKQPVKVYRDVTGFIGNRLQHALWREAIGLVEAGVCDAEAIDMVVKNSFGMRMPVLGPMENADLVGLELTRAVHEVLFPDLRSDSTPSPLLDHLIGAGHVGMKSGRGLRTWTADQADEVRRQLAQYLIAAAGRAPVTSR